MTPILAGLVTVVGGATFIGLMAWAAHAAAAAGAGNAAGAAIQAIGPVAIHTKSAAFNEAADAAGNTVETVIKGVLTGAKLQAFLEFVATKPSEAQILAWLETNAGAPLVSQCMAAMPALLKEELGILGHHVPDVIGSLIAKLAPDVAHDVAAKTLSSAEVAAKLTSLSEPKAA